MPLSAKDLRKQLYEQGLPDYLQHDLDAYKDGMKTHSPLLDCLWGELYGSINMAEISDGLITPNMPITCERNFCGAISLSRMRTTAIRAK